MRFLYIAAVAFTMIGAVVTTPTDALASATGCDNKQYFDDTASPNAISAEIKLPYGYLCHLIHTNGKEISEQKAAYTSKVGIYSPLVANICNWRIDFVYYDTKGKEYMRDKGSTESDCKKGVSRKVADIRKLSHYGTTCAELYIDGHARMTQCHTINE